MYVHTTAHRHTCIRACKVRIALTLIPVLLPAAYFYGLKPLTRLSTLKEKEEEEGLLVHSISQGSGRRMEKRQLETTSELTQRMEGE